MTIRFALTSLTLALAGLGACQCGPLLPVPPKQCDTNGVGCLSDEICLDFKCVPRPKCATDDDCGDPAFACVLPAQVCEIREGFGQECKEPAAPCAPGDFCALGICRPSAPEAGATRCSLETDCATGQKCDRVHFFCIPDADCRLADKGYPELACDPGVGGNPGEQCDAVSGRCILPCQNKCTTDDDCNVNGGSNHCNGSCQCVQCLSDADCGPGLSCDARSGQCLSDNICRSNSDCTLPLVCDPGTAQCEVPPPPCSSDFDCPIGDQCDPASSICFSPTGPCEDDRFEPNNTPAQGQVLTIPPDVRDGLQLCKGDDDVYALTLSAGDAITIQAIDTDPQSRATVWLLDSSGETSIGFAETPPRGDGTIHYTAQVDEVVYLRLTALLKDTEYSLVFDLESGSICAPDFFEGGTNNDTIVNATPPEAVPDGVTLSGTICPGDKDLYRLDVAAGEAIDASLSFDATHTDLDLAFLDDQGNLVAQNGAVAEPETLRHRFVAAGTMYVRVVGFGNNIGDYSLVVNHEPPFQCTADVAEPDNDPATVTPLGLGVGIPPTPRTMCAGDEDWIVTPLEDFERLIVSTQYNDADVELGVEVFDATGTTLKVASPAANGGAAVSYNAQGNETVAVKIRGLGGAIGAYTLEVQKENQLDCAPDDLEPDDTVEGAVNPPAAGQLLSICGSDEDYFSIAGNAGKKLVVDASFRQSEADIDLILLGLDGSQILASADGTGDGEHLEAILPLDGVYTLRVFSLSSNPRARYSLSVQQVAP